MISSNIRARKWFEEQTRQRTIEQIIATLDQVFLKTKDLNFYFSFYLSVMHFLINKMIFVLKQFFDK